jgi:hypothetical protein
MYFVFPQCGILCFIIFAYLDFSRLLIWYWEDILTQENPEFNGNTKYHTVGTVLISSFFVDQCILGRNKGPRIFIRPNNMGFTEANAMIGCWNILHCFFRSVCLLFNLSVNLSTINLKIELFADNVSTTDLVIMSICERKNLYFKLILSKLKFRSTIRKTESRNCAL